MISYTYKHELNHVPSDWHQHNFSVASALLVSTHSSLHFPDKDRSNYKPWIS